MQGVSDLCGRGIHVGVALEMVHLLIMGVVSKWVWDLCGCGIHVGVASLLSPCQDMW